MNLEEYFTDLEIYALILERRSAIETLDAAIDTYSNLLSFGEMLQPSDITSQADISALYAGISPLNQAMLLHNLKAYVFDKLRCGLRDDEATDARIAAVASLIVPNIQYEHFDEAEIGTIKIKVDGDTAAYFKSGYLRRQNDQFLFEFYQFMKEMMALPDDFNPVFLPVKPCSIRFFELPEVTLADPGDFELEERIGTRLRQISLPLSNRANFKAAIPGAMQAALPEWTLETSPPSSIDVLLFLTFICLLGARDIKVDGIKGTGAGSLVDFEDFLWEKVQLEGGPAPKLHIPFHSLISQLDVSAADWAAYCQYCQKIDVPRMLDFVRAYDFQQPNFDDVRHHASADAREEYKIKRPDFRDGKLLAVEQVDALARNAHQLLAIVKRFAGAKQAGKVFDLFAGFDQHWLEQHYVYVAWHDAYSNKASEFRQFFLEVDLAHGRCPFVKLSPEDCVGLPIYRPASPTKDFWRSSSYQSLRESTESDLGRSSTPPSEARERADTDSTSDNDDTVLVDISSAHGAADVSPPPSAPSGRAAFFDQTQSAPRSGRSLLREAGDDIILKPDNP